MKILSINKHSSLLLPRLFHPILILAGKAPSLACKYCEGLYLWKYLTMLKIIDTENALAYLLINIDDDQGKVL
jgi:hypothetical protein